MAVIVAEPEKHARCICCGSNQRIMYEFQFFQEVGSKTCVTLCGACVHQMDSIVIEKACDRYEEIHYGKLRSSVRK